MTERPPPKRITAEEFLAAGLPEGTARLVRFAYRVRHGQRQRADDMRFLAVAFDQIVAGADAKKALGISGRQHQGRKKLTAREREADLHIAVGVLKLMAGGMTRDEAIAEIAGESSGKQFDEAERLYERDRRLALSLMPTIRWLESKK